MIHVTHAELGMNPFRNFRRAKTSLAALGAIDALALFWTKVSLLPSSSETTADVRVTAIGSIIDPTTRRQLVRSEVEDPDHHLRSGMYASFVLGVGDSVRSPAVPADGVVREGDGTMTVWVTKDSRQFTKRTVITGLRENGWVQILHGLQPDERLVTEGAVFLSNKLLLGDTG